MAQICKVCRNISWHELPPEDWDAHPHYASRADLEASALSCPLCRLVLKAALSSEEQTCGRRHGKGFWKVFENVSYVQEGREPRGLNFIKDFGASQPSAIRDYCFPRSKRTVNAMFAPTGKIDRVGEHVEHSMTERESRLLLAASSSATAQTWIYGNYWADGQPQSLADKSNLKLVGIGARFGGPRNLLSGNDGKSVVYKGSGISICAKDNSSFTYIPGRKPAMHSDSELAFTRLEAWVTACNKPSGSHAHCRPSRVDTALPTRVLDLDFSATGIALIHSGGKKRQYVALSHSWGSSPRLIATSQTMDQLKNGIEVSSLPKTFQDAITVTRRLLVRYLWIDCLCIIQDDPKDWEQQAALMADVYYNAYLTIAAASSKDSSTGCFPSRLAQPYVSPATRSLGYDTLRDLRQGFVGALVGQNTGSQAKGSSANDRTLYFFEEWLPGSMYHYPQKTDIGSFGKEFDPIASSPLSNRGWTLQERLLSPRTIHYAQDQMYFECRSGIHSEDGFTFPETNFNLLKLLGTQLLAFEKHGIPKDSGLSFTRGQAAQQSGVGIRETGGWLSLVANYSRRQLKFNEDKLSALSGLARLLAENTGDRYYAGIWHDHVYEELSWRTYPQDEIVTQDEHTMKTLVIKGEHFGKVTRPSRYRAPSWSWASLDGPIRFVALSYRNLVARLVSCSVHPSGDDIYGRVCHGRIKLETPVFEMRPFTAPSQLNRHGIPVHIDLADDRGKSIGVVHLDVPDEMLPFPCYALFLDTANAIVVTGNSLACKHLALVTRAISMSMAGHSKPLDFLRREVNAAFFTPSFFNVKRIGVANFVQGSGTLGADGFWRSDTITDEEIASRQPTELGKDAIEQMVQAIKEGRDTKEYGIIYGDATWGPIRQQDMKMSLTIV